MFRINPYLLAAAFVLSTFATSSSALDAASVSKDDVDDWRREQFDPAPFLRQLRCPVLALFAERDVFVPPAENVAKMERYLREAGNKDVTTKVFPSVGHDMELSRSLTTGRWKWPNGYWVRPRKAPDYDRTIVTWIWDRVEARGHHVDAAAGGVTTQSD